MIPRPPRSTLPYPLFPYTTLFRSRLRQSRRYATGSQPGVAFAARVDFGNRRAVFWLYDAFLARARDGGPGLWTRRVLAPSLSASRLFYPFERNTPASERPHDIDRPIHQRSYRITPTLGGECIAVGLLR